MNSRIQQQQAWAENYERRRADGHAGWGSDKQYEDKKTRLESAIRRYRLSPGTRWLELGCGAGNVAAWLAEQGYAVTGIDLVSEAVAWAKERCKLADFHVGDVTRMRMFAGGQFDVVYEGDCLHMVLDEARLAALREVRRVLKPGGLFLCGVNVARTDLTDVVIRHRSGKVAYDPRDQTVYVEGRREYHLADAESFRQELRSAGFQIVHETALPPRGNRAYMAGWLEVDAR